MIDIFGQVKLSVESDFISKSSILSGEDMPLSWIDDDKKYGLMNNLSYIYAVSFFNYDRRIINNSRKAYSVTKTVFQMRTKAVLFKDW